MINIIFKNGVLLYLHWVVRITRFSCRENRCLQTGICTSLCEEFNEGLVAGGYAIGSTVGQTKKRLDLGTVGVKKRAVHSVFSYLRM